MNLGCRVLIVFSFVCLRCTAQTNDFSFFIEKVRTDYPGFNDKTDSAKFENYALSILRQNPKDTFKAMSIVANSFNDKHLQISQTKESITVNIKACNKAFLAATQYLNGKRPKKKYEGYWLNDYNNCIIGIKQVSANPLIYKAYVIESRDSFFPRGRVLGTYESIDTNTFLTDAISTFSKKRFFTTSTFRNDSVFTTGAEGKWKKMEIYTKPVLKNLPEFNYSPTRKVIDEHTYILKIPGATVTDGQAIDSIVKADFGKIARSQTLIIDLTNNPGGKSGVYTPLWPFLYTNPIIKNSAATYSTDDNISQIENAVLEYRNSTTDIDSAGLNQALEWIKLLKENKGKFVPAGIDTIRYDSIYSTPRNVGIIINYAGQSATELMLFMAKQSKKVTLFGEHTMGAADYLDYSPVFLPSKKYKLYMPTSKRAITKDAPKIDGIGIYPDISIPDQVQDWQKFVVDHYAKH